MGEVLSAGVSIRRGQNAVCTPGPATTLHPVNTHTRTPASCSFRPTIPQRFMPPKSWLLISATRMVFRASREEGLPHHSQVSAGVCKRPVYSLAWPREATNSKGMEAIKPASNHSGLHFWTSGLHLTADASIIKFKTAGKAK